jgi:putative ABC transport system permease protein
LLYSFRNIFRRKVRMVLALQALSAAGAIFIAVVSVRASFRLTLDKVAGYWQEEINISLYDPYRFKQLERLTAQVSGINHIEARLKANAFRIYADDSESTHTLDVVGVDPRSAFLQPELLAGRWLQPDDKQGAVINVDFLELEPNTQVGDQLRLNIEGRESDWRVVGIVTSQVVGSREPLMAPIAYVDYTELTQALGRYGDANQLLIQAPGDVSDQVAQVLEQNLKRHNIGIASVLLHDDIRWAMENGFEILFNVLQIMSVIFGAVGGLGLMSMMSLNVLERTREIGIIRSIGGVRSQLAQMVMVESIFVGVLSWAIGSILAYPLSFYLSNMLGVTLFRVPFNHTFPLTGSLLWLGIVVILAIFSSLLPAHNASRLSISQTLMYE